MINIFFKCGLLQIIGIEEDSMNEINYELNINMFLSDLIPRKGLLIILKP